MCDPFRSRRQQCAWMVLIAASTSAALTAARPLLHDAAEANFEGARTPYADAKTAENDSRMPEPHTSTHRQLLGHDTPRASPSSLAAADAAAALESGRRLLQDGDSLLAVPEDHQLDTPFGNFLAWNYVTWSYLFRQISLINSAEAWEQTFLYWLRWFKLLDWRNSCQDGYTTQFQDFNCRLLYLFYGDRPWLQRLADAPGDLRDMLGGVAAALAQGSP